MWLANLFDNFSCVRIFISVCAKSESNGDSKTAENDGAPEDESPSSPAEVKASKEDEWLRLRSVVCLPSFSSIFLILLSNGLPCAQKCCSSWRAH